jgi:hypothetical protein
MTPKKNTTWCPTFAKLTWGHSNRRERILEPAAIRFLTVVAVLVALAGWMFSFGNKALAANPDVKIQLTTNSAGPRQVEDSTEQAIVRDYGKAWQAMSAARAQNRPDLLSTLFTGFAKDEITQAIEAQKRNNVSQRMTDRSHKLQAIFYSQEGSALQLRDTAQVEIQVLDGTNVIHTENATINYLVLMTPTADHWQVRMLQAVPNF